VRRAPALLAATLATLAFAACGSNSGAAPEPPPRPAETAHRLPPLEPGWRPFVNRYGGYALGLPPGWEAQRRGTATRVSSFDGLAGLVITADRTGEGVELPIEEYAARFIAARPGYEEALEPAAPRRFEHRYAGVVVEAEGVAVAEGTGVEQRVEAIVLRRPERVTLAAVITVNAIPQGAESRRVAERIVKTIRSQPLGAGG